MQKLTNNAKANLNANISNAVTAIVLQGGQGALFPALSAGDYFYASLINNSNVIEIVKVTARAVDTLTVVRGQEGTAANAYSAGDRVELRLTAAGIGATQQEAAKAVALAGTDVYTGTLSPAPTAYNPNQLYYGAVANANLTTTPSVNFNAFGALTVTRLDGSALVPGDMAAGMVAILSTNAAANGFLLLNPATVVQPAQGTVAAAATVNLDTSPSPYQQITGNTGITAFTLANGHVRIVEFSGTPLITNGANLILPGGANIQAAAGDTAIVCGEAGSVARVVAYIPASGKPIVAGTAGTGITVTGNTIAVSLPTLSSSLGGDVALTPAGTNVDGPSVAQGAAGTWLAIASGTFTSDGNPGSVSAKLWDGTNTKDSCQVVPVTTNAISFTLMGIFSAPPGNIRLTANANPNTGKLRANISGFGADTTLVVVRIA